MLLLNILVLKLRPYFRNILAMYVLVIVIRAVACLSVCLLDRKGQGIKSARNKNKMINWETKNMNMNMNGKTERQSREGLGNPRSRKMIDRPFSRLSPTANMAYTTYQWSIYLSIYIPLSLCVWGRGGSVNGVLLPRVG